MVELLVVIAVIATLAAILLPALGKARIKAQALYCLNNGKQLTLAWKMYAGDNAGRLPAALGGNAPRYHGRPNWLTGELDFNGANRSNWDVNRDLAKSTLWAYAGESAAVFKCPADRTTVLVQGKTEPRVRSYSMSQAFGTGDWLNGGPVGSSPGPWRIYAQESGVVNPSLTWLLVDEHPNSINDAAFAVTCAGNQSTDPPNASRVVDFPASYHNGACSFSFADGHSEMHKWTGNFIKQPADPSHHAKLPLNVPARDSWADMHWLAERTSVLK